MERNVQVYGCCPEPYPDVTFTLHIRRRTLYYTYNVIIPCVMLSCLSLLGFWMPPETGEKVALGLTILLAFSVFMLLIAESMPASSFYIPLIGETILPLNRPTTKILQCKALLRLFCHTKAESNICLLLNSLSRHDALKHHLTSLKTDFIFSQLRVLEGNFRRDYDSFL